MTLRTGQSSERENQPARYQTIATRPHSSDGCSDLDGSVISSSDHLTSSPGGGATCLHRHADGRTAIDYCGRSEAVHPRCDRPSKLVCSLCGFVIVGRCKATRESKCKPCARSHRSLLVQVAQSGMTDTPSGFFFVTLTAPGQKQLPWDKGLCRHDPALRCSGKMGCKVDEFYGAQWNGHAPKRWSYVRQYLVRKLGRDVQCWGVWEWQERGVLHRHFLVRVDGVVSQDTMRKAVGSLRSSLGFGPQMRCDAITGDAAREIWYCASYSTKTADSVDGHRLLDPRTGELKQSSGFRAWSCSRRWGDSVKVIRGKHSAWAAAGRTAAAGVPVGDPAGGALDSFGDISTSQCIEGGHSCSDASLALLV